MTSQQYLLGIDVGTSGCKAVLVDSTGNVIATATNEYALSTPRPNWSEQDPEDWWSATVASIKSVLSKCHVGAGSVVAVGLTGQMHGATLLDSTGSVLRPAILWNDQRTADECAEITRRVGDERVVQLTGNPVLTGFTAPKLLWVSRHEPEVFARIAAVLLPKDYVRFRLCGERHTDVSDASGTSMFDVADRRWSDEMIEAAGAKRSWLPEVSESPVVTAKINADAARLTGLSEGTPIVAGAGDQAAQAVGAGIVKDGDVCITIGTSGVVFAAGDRYRVEPGGRLHAFCHAVPGMWHLMGVMLSAGGCLRWVRDTLGEPECLRAKSEGRDPYDVLTEVAMGAPPGCEGLLFLPYLTGERTPHADPNARGVFFGLTLRHTKAHLIRAVLEGVAYGLRDSLELIRGLGITIDSVRVSGGGARSTVWRQIIADVLGCPLVAIGETEGAAYGAALLAGVGVGAFDSVEGAANAVRVTDQTTPGSATEVYERNYPLFRSIYTALKPGFEALARAERAE